MLVMRHDQIAMLSVLKAELEAERARVKRAEEEQIAYAARERALDDQRAWLLENYGSPVERRELRAKGGR